MSRRGCLMFITHSYSKAMVRGRLTIRTAGLTSRPAPPVEQLTRWWVVKWASAVTGVTLLDWPRACPPGAPRVSVWWKRLNFSLVWAGVNGQRDFPLGGQVSERMTLLTRVWTREARGCSPQAVWRRWALL